MVVDELTDAEVDRIFQALADATRRDIVARSLRTVFDGARDEARKAAVEAAQARIMAYRTLSNSFGAQIPTIKAMVAAHRRDPQWAETRPPLVCLGEPQLAKLEAELARIAA